VGYKELLKIVETRHTYNLYLGAKMKSKEMSFSDICTYFDQEDGLKIGTTFKRHVCMSGTCIAILTFVFLIPFIF
jgi:hypothetical protein